MKKIATSSIIYYINRSSSKIEIRPKGLDTKLHRITKQLHTINMELIAKSLASHSRRLDYYLFRLFHTYPGLGAVIM